MLSSIIYIAIAIIVLMFMITVHEFGHYLAGKLLGFKINEFSVGFGKAIYKRTNKKTGEVFALRVVPIGGYCAFEGDDAAAGEGGARADAATRASLDGKEALKFNEHAPWKRLIVLFSGAFFNFLSAILFSILLLMVIGYQQHVTIDGFRADAIATNSELAQVEVGDSIVAINGKRLTLLNHFNSVYKKAYIEGEDVTLTISHDGNEFDITAKVFLEKWMNSEGNQVEFYGPGLEYAKTVTYDTMNFRDALQKCVGFTFEVAWLILVTLWGIVSGSVNFNDIGGPISTVSVMAKTMRFDVSLVLWLIPLISVNLALFNLLPIPALDGARMVFVGIEWIRGKPINPDIEARIHMCGLVILFGLVIIADFNYLLALRYLVLGRLRL